MATGRFMIYGATGYTGKLTARFAKEERLSPILAGRNQQKTQEVADLYGFEWRAFDLSDSAKLDAALKEVDVVLHIAGPFSATSKLMADACLRTGRHYLDITGELHVFESLAARDAEAKSKGVMLLPGVGFDVVPSDCLSAHLKRRLPDATHLKIAIGGLGKVSRGTAKTFLEGIGVGTSVRHDGKIVVLPGTLGGTADFGLGPKKTLAVSWGDVSTAWYSTHIPNIEVYFELVGNLKWMSKIGSFMRFLLSTSPAQSFLKSMIDKQPEGPTDAERAENHTVLVGEATNRAGQTVKSRLRTSDGYTLTALTGLEIAKRVVKGDFKPGFQTPSMAYGADFVLQFPDITREDFN